MGKFWIFDQLLWSTYSVFCDLFFMNVSLKVKTWLAGLPFSRCSIWRINFSKSSSPWRLFFVNFEQFFLGWYKRVYSGLYLIVILSIKQKKISDSDVYISFVCFKINYCSIICRIIYRKYNLLILIFSNLISYLYFCILITKQRINFPFFSIFVFIS